jgi:drug/metabolite transporter (DMT)-like permease
VRSINKEAKEELMNKKASNRPVAVAFILIVLFTGFNAIAVKSSDAELPPFFGAAIRFGIAAILLIAIMLVLRLPLPRGRSFWGAILFGILGSGISRALLYYALVELPAGTSMVLLALVPLLTCLFACMHKQEIFQWKSLTGSILAVGGIAIIFNTRVQASLPILPVLAVIGAAACYAEAIVIIKNFPQSHPITTNAIALTTGSLLLFVFSALWKESPTMPNLASTWESLVYLIIFGTLATFVLTVYVIKNWSASASSYQFVLFPIITMIVGVRMANETMNVALLLGSLLVLIGAYIGGIAKNGQFKLVYIRLVSRLRVPHMEG